MSYFLGIDTSNYTTSISVYNSETANMLRQKKLLPVRHGECGLRQSDAVFHHVQQLPEIAEELLRDFDGEFTAVGVSVRPRDAEGSYMPCFTVGTAAARILAAVLKVPLYTFSHQCGHIAAALYSSKRTDLIGEKFLAFHVSGGTTEAVIVRPDDENIFSVELVGRTLDLNAGQLIDRIGVMMGLDFPAGKELEKYALENKLSVKGKATLKGTDCCLSGIENICRREYENSSSKEYVSALCLKYVENTLYGMCDAILRKYGNMPVIFAGGVMSNKIIKEELKKGIDAWFAEPEFSADNASGTAFLTYLKHKTTTE